MKRSLQVFLFFLIVLLTSICIAASFLPARITALESEINSLKNSLDMAKLEMRRLDYTLLDSKIKALEIDLLTSKNLVENDEEYEAEISLVSNITATLKELEPLFYESLPVETRGMWVDNFTINSFFTREDVARHLDELKAINVNIIFPDVYGNGAAIYPSKIVPQQSRFVVFFKDDDVLKIIIEEAHKRGIEVHPLVRVFALHNGAEYFINDKVEWLDKTNANKFTLANGYYWLSPANPEVREYNIDMLKELARNYNIDGIHLDYIRFDADFGYNAFMRDLFTNLFGIDPFDIKSDRMLDIFKVFKSQFVNKFVEHAFYELKAIKPNLLISAAVASPYSWGKNDLGQDWLNWALNRHVNFLTPMSYRSTVEQYSSTVKSEVNTVSGITYIYTGIGVYLFNDSILLGQLKAGQDTTMTGQAVFSTANMKYYHYNVLKNGPWSKPAVPTFRDPHKAANLQLLDLIQRINEFKSFINTDTKLLDEYLLKLENITLKVATLNLRPWDTRDLRADNPDEVSQLEPILNETKELINRINRDCKRENLLPPVTAERIINDLNCFMSLLQPLLYTSLPFEYISTK